MEIKSKFAIDKYGLLTVNYAADVFSDLVLGFFE